LFAANQNNREKKERKNIISFSPFVFPNIFSGVVLRPA